jgi:Fe-S cluster assembly ATP-binding protein
VNLLPAVNTLLIKDLYVSVEGKPILKGLNLQVESGSVHAIMGPNGSGKSTLAYTLMGHPRYKVEGGQVFLNQQDILAMTPDQRSKAGLFLAFQYPSEVPGVSLSNFLRAAVNAKNDKEHQITIKEYTGILKEKMELLKMDPSFAERYLNEGFSGGEKKRNEILQMAMLQPKFAVLDEIDSGLDIDALQTVSQGINSLRSEERGIILITHYPRIMRYIVPDYVHVLVDGRIIKSGGKELALQLDEEGYDRFLNLHSEAKEQ